MYAFIKMTQMGFSPAGITKQPQRSKKAHIPNEALLLAFQSYTMDPLNIEDWLTYWRQHLTEVVRSNILYPKPPSSLIKHAATDLKRQLEAQTTKLRQLELIDPNTLEPPKAIGNITCKILAATSSSSTSHISSSSAPEKSLVSPERIRRRKPLEQIQQLYTHVAAISTNCAQAYGKCQNLNVPPPPLHAAERIDNGELEPDALLINVLAHQIGGLDVSLSASMSQSCKLFLEGIHEIIDTIDFVCDVRNAFYKQLSPEEIETHRSNTLSIIRLLDKVNTMIAFNSDLKYYFIKLQMEALLVISWPPGSTFFTNSINSLRNTVRSLLKILEETPDLLVSIDWEKEDEFLRDQYFTIMEKHYFAKRRFSNQYNSAILKKLNYHADWLKFLHEKFSGNPTAATDRPQDFCGDASDSDNNVNISPPNKTPTQDMRYRRYRDSKELIIHLTNHLLHINNSRTKFIRLSMINDLKEDDPRKGIRSPERNKLTVEESVQILENILRHQIAGLDIALSSEIFNSIKCFLHGLYDTSCSIMNIMSERYYNRHTGEHLPLRPSVYTTGTHEGDGDGNEGVREEEREARVQRIQETLEICKEMIARKKAKKPKWKHTLLKLQLEALLLTQCSPDTEIFREYLEIMAGTAESAYEILNQQWFIPYLSICWDDASAEDQQVFYSYWELLEICLESRRE